MSGPPRAAAALDARPAALLVDGWYAQAFVGDGAADLDLTLSLRFGEAAAQAARRSALLRGVLWFIASRGSEQVVCPFASRGLLVFLALHRVLSRRPPRIHLLEFFREEPKGPWPRCRAFVQALVLRALLPRLLTGAQVLSRGEPAFLARTLGVPAVRFRFIAFPLRVHTVPAAPVPREGSATVLAFGAAGGDWATLLAAAAHSPWPLTILCSAAERPGLEALDTQRRARVLEDVSPEQLPALLGQATVFALVPCEQRSLRVQAALAQAMESRVPVVATAVAALDGHVEDGVTALSVPVGDAARLKAAIDTLWQDPAARDALSRGAHAALHARTPAAYLERIREFVLAAPPRD